MNKDKVEVLKELKQWYYKKADLSPNGRGNAFIVTQQTFLNEIDRLMKKYNKNQTGRMWVGHDTIGYSHIVDPRVESLCGEEIIGEVLPTNKESDNNCDECAQIRG